MDEEPFEIILADSNEESAQYRLQNEPGERQREHVTGYDRKDALRVLGKLVHVVHGTAGDDNDNDGEEEEGTPCSLAIFEFAALGQKPGRRRYREVQIEIVFAAHGPRSSASSSSSSDNSKPSSAVAAKANDLARYDPQVSALAPHGARALHRSTHAARSKHGFEAFAQAGAEPAGTAGARYTYEVGSAASVRDAMAVEGAPAYVGRAAGKPNAARFTLRENESQRSGVPRLLRVAVLLRRRRGDKLGLFVATVAVRARVSVWADAGEIVRRIVGRVPRDDAVVFDPACRPTTDRFPVGRLALVDLDGECAVESGLWDEEPGVGDGVGSDE
ncbi:hypothetical protein GGR54DRAFT_139434 [Hypoxylon sp. NC1633]|nr:hypothetical protein GGR54DRAFT_139434 [Hypoxylon sp. NC1633]